MKLSAAMKAVLLNAAHDRALLTGCVGRSSHGGRTQSIAALKKRGLLTTLGTSPPKAQKSRVA